MKKSLYLAGAATFALMLATPAMAQDAPAGDAATEETTEGGDIIVTAQKRSERLQDVPIAISVVSGDRLAAQGGINLETAQLLIPTLNIQKSGTTLNQSLFMRGVGTATFSTAGEPSVSTVVDGVVYSRAGEAFGDLVDIDRIEVLRGPQGTLFGKNASAGVINIVTKRPGKEFGGTVDAAYFTESEFRGRVAVDVPLSEDIRSRWVGFYSNFDGNIENVTTGTTVNGYERYGVRGMLEIDAASDVKFTLIGDYRESDDDCCAQLIGTVGTGLAFQVLPTPLGDETRTVSQNLVTRTEEKSWGLSLQADIGVGEHTLTSISAYRDYYNLEIRDGDWLPQAYIGLPQLHDESPTRGKTFTQEIRLASPTGQFLEYVLGAFYSWAETDRTFIRRSILCNAAALPAPTTATPCTSPLAAPSRTPVGTADFTSTFKNLSFFADGTVNMTDNVRFIAGVRWTKDILDVSHQRVATGLDIVGGNPVATGGTNPNFGPFIGRAENTNWSGRAGLQVDVSDDSVAYATYVRGYKGPAFNLFYNLGATGTNVIEPETSDSFELGLKNTLFDNALTFNLAVFYAKYDNFQANNPDLIPGTPPTVVARFTNAGKVSTRGVEIDLVARPASGLTINGSLAYTDAHVDQFRLPPGANPADVIPSGTPLLFAPEWKGALGVDYKLGVTDTLDLMLGAQGSYQSSQLSIFSPSAVTRALGTIPGYGLVNLSVGIGDNDGKWQVTAHVRNLFDTSFAAFLEAGGPGGSIRYQIPRDADRYFGITGRFNF